MCPCSQFCMRINRCSIFYSSSDRSAVCLDCSVISDRQSGRCCEGCRFFYIQCMFRINLSIIRNLCLTVYISTLSNKENTVQYCCYTIQSSKAVYPGIDNINGFLFPHFFVKSHNTVFFHDSFCDHNAVHDVDSTKRIQRISHFHIRNGLYSAVCNINSISYNL